MWILALWCSWGFVFSLKSRGGMGIEMRTIAQSEIWLCGYIVSILSVL